ncbi:MAG: LamG domain-containing protein [Kofleriaceae bacterium]|nr:LamG domain-containing protein [Kofleriaceae bacterium]
MRTSKEAVPCTSDEACVAAFGAGATCKPDGYCSVSSTTEDGGQGDGPGSAATYPWRFVSIPDFLDADIGDVSSLTTTGVNSTNAAHEAAITAVLDAIAAEHPDFVLVAGNLVNGHWYLDADGKSVFGPVATPAQKKAAIDKAADHYYKIWKKRFADRGLTVYPAVGAHELGDNNWPVGTKADLVSTYKAAFARNFTQAGGTAVYPLRPIGTPYEGTSYAIKHKGMLLVSLDEFRQDDPMTTLDPNTGTVVPDVSADHLAWLESTINDARANDPKVHVVVQGNVPVLLPVRRQGTSSLLMPGEDSSPLWRALVRDKADLYLAGGAHDVTARSSGSDEIPNGSVQQVVHGGALGYSRTASYVVGTVYQDRIELQVKTASVSYDPSVPDQLWQAGSNRPRAGYTLSAFTSAGDLLVDKTGPSTQYLNPSGVMVAPTTGTTAGALVNLRFDEATGTNKVYNLGATGDANHGLPTTGLTFVQGKLGNAVSFPDVVGANQRIMAGSSPIVGAGPRTSSLWVQVPTAHPSGTPETWPQAIRTVCTMGMNQAGAKWELDIDENGLFEIGVANKRTDNTGNSPVNDNTWHHIVAVLPATAANLSGAVMYIDGHEVTKAGTVGNGTGAINTGPGNFIVGHAVNSAYFQQYTGQVDDLAIWGDSLSAAQVLAMYQLATTSGFGYDAYDVDALFEAFKVQRDVTIDGRLWAYRPSGLTSPPGEVTLTGATYSLNLGDGAGFESR